MPLQMETAAVTRRTMELATSESSSCRQGAMLRRTTSQAR